ncbi:type VII secretion system-associated protein [Actinokineospora soli]|uniref:Type VII secretion system-associated protein n=1 Tax=Actinokineospora soli TaxID=1048753 RepID=A0ABW2TWI6_9PSEU
MDQPEITLDMRIAARSNPGSLLHVIDPAFADDEDVPPWAVVGAYPVDRSGEIREVFHPNPDYRPSPRALRMPVPSNEAERVMQLVKTRHLPQSALIPALRAARLLVYARDGRDTGITAFPNHDGRVMVPACTSVGRVPKQWPAWRELTGAALAPLLEGFTLVVNPSGPITAIVPARDLLG